MIQIKDRPQPQLLLDELQTEKFGRTNAFFQELGSTNSYIKQNVQVLESGFTAVANFQTGGRGRLGKSFESPSGGLYMSLLVKDLRSEDISSATVKSAVAVSEALEDFLGLEHETLGIKWVNDILYDGKKVCGILCELVRDANENCLVIGIGVNILSISRKASADVRKTAYSLAEIAGDKAEELIGNNVREKLCAMILEKLEHYIYLDMSACIETYRERSVVVGKNVYVIKGKDKVFNAHVYGITDDAKLCVCYDDGHFEMLYSGDVSIRKE